MRGKSVGEQQSIITRSGQIDLVQNGNDLEIGFKREEVVCYSLRLDALCTVNKKQGPLAGCQRA